MKFLVDMNLSPKWAEFLTQAGWSSIHWSTVGPASAPDKEVMAYAATGGFTALTHDLDFGAILSATGGGKPSVVQVRSANVSPLAITHSHLHKAAAAKA